MLPKVLLGKQARPQTKWQSFSPTATMASPAHASTALSAPTSSIHTCVPDCRPLPKTKDFAAGGQQLSSTTHCRLHDSPLGGPKRRASSPAARFGRAHERSPGTLPDGAITETCADAGPPHDSHDLRQVPAEPLVGDAAEPQRARLRIAAGAPVRAWSSAGGKLPGIAEVLDARGAPVAAPSATGGGAPNLATTAKERGGSARARLCGGAAAPRHMRSGDGGDTSNRVDLGTAVEAPRRAIERVDVKAPV